MYDMYDNLIWHFYHTHCTKYNCFDCTYFNSFPTFSILYKRVSVKNYELNSPNCVTFVCLLTIIFYVPKNPININTSKANKQEH